jgi:hypothetical protein
MIVHEHYSDLFGIAQGCLSSAWQYAYSILCTKYQQLWGSSGPFDSNHTHPSSFFEPRIEPPTGTENQVVQLFGAPLAAATDSMSGVQDAAKGS